MGTDHGSEGRRIATGTHTVAAACAAVVMLVVLSGCGTSVAQEASPTPAAVSDVFDPAVADATPIAGVETFAIASADHTKDPVDYPQNPPAGGPHDPSWQKCAVYDAPVRNENAVHSLEHGAVWITYQPDLPAADKESLKLFAADKPYLLVSPYPGLDSPLVASGWGAQLRLEEVDDPRLATFITRYAGKGPEPGATCDTGVETTVSG